MQAGKLRGFTAQLRYSTQTAFSKLLDMSTGPSAKKELEENDRSIYLRSLLKQDRIEALQSFFEMRIANNVLSPLIAAVESSDKQLSDNGTGTSPSDIILQSLYSPFSQFCPTSGCSFLERPEGTTSSLAYKPRAAQLLHMFTQEELQILMACYLDDLRALSTRKEDRIIKLGICQDGDVREFAQKVLRHANANVDLLSAVAKFASVDLEEAMGVIYNLVDSLLNLPVGEYSYNIAAVGALVDKTLEAQHRGVLVEPEGLMVEVTSIKSVSAVAVRPTSFVSFMERALMQKPEYRQGIFQQVMVNPFPVTQLRQRAIQMVGAWNYHLIGQNCDTFARWVTEDEQLCTFESSRGLKSTRKGVQTLFTNL